MSAGLSMNLGGAASPPLTMKPMRRLQGRAERMLFLRIGMHN